MDWTQQRENFRAVLGGNRCIHPGSVYDALSARVAESLGFEVGMFSGSIASLSVLGAPDLTVTTLTEFAAQANRICRAGKLSLLVDADHGFGNALNVMRTVEELETAGVSALTIEDTLLPRAYGVKKVQLIPIEEGVGKMRAALRARQDPRLIIVGRTAAVEVNGIDDAVARARAYEETGVDALFFAGVTTRAEVEALANATTCPLMLGNLTPELVDLDYLASRRIRIGLQGHQPFFAALQAAYVTLKALREGTKPSDLKNLPSPELIKLATRDADYAEWTREFLGG